MCWPGNHEDMSDQSEVHTIKVIVPGGTHPDHVAAHAEVEAQKLVGPNDRVVNVVPRRGGPVDEDTGQQEWTCEYQILPPGGAR